MKKLMTRVLTVALAGALFITPVFAKEVGFKDVTQKDWFYNSVTNVAKAGIIEGESFRPNEVITEGEFVEMLHKALAKDGSKDYYKVWESKFKPQPKVIQYDLNNEVDAVVLDWADYSNPQKSLDKFYDTSSWRLKTASSLMIDYNEPELMFKDLSGTVFNVNNKDRALTRNMASYITNEYLNNYSVDFGRPASDNVVDTREKLQKYFVDGSYDVSLQNNRAYSTAVDNMLYWGLITSTGKDGFKGEDKMTRAEATVIIDRIINEDARKPNIEAIDKKIKAYNDLKESAEKEYTETLIKEITDYQNYWVSKQEEFYKSSYGVNDPENYDSRVNYVKTTDDYLRSDKLNNTLDIRAKECLKFYNHRTPYNVMVCTHRDNDGKPKHFNNDCGSLKLDTSIEVNTIYNKLGDKDSWALSGDVVDLADEAITMIVINDLLNSKESVKSDIKYEIWENFHKSSAGHAGIIAQPDDNYTQGYALEIGYGRKASTGTEDYIMTIVVGSSLDRNNLPKIEFNEDYYNDYKNDFEF